MISRRLKEYRLRENLNQEGIAKVAGLTQAAWVGWEKKPPQALASLAAICRHYGVSADWFLNLSDDPTPRRGRLDDMHTQLLDAARKLPHYKQRDLLAIAQALQDTRPQDDATRLDDIKDMILDAFRARGSVEEKRALLRWLMEAAAIDDRNGNGLLPFDGSDQPEE